MSLVETLAKVAVGVALAKGVSSLTRGRGQAAPAAASGNSVFGASAAGGGIGGMLGGLMGGNGTTGSGGLGDMLGGMMGGGAAPAGASSGGLGGMLGGLMGGSGAAGSGGGLGAMLGGMMGGGSGSTGGLGAMLGQAMAGGSGAAGLGGLLDGLGGGAGGAAAAAAPAAGSLGGLLNQALSGESPAQPDPQNEEAAGVLLRAMIQAAKCDGRIDAEEQKALTDHLGTASAREKAFVEAEMKRPVDVEGLVRDTPRGMEQQVYMMSLVGLDLDSQAEAQYLDNLGTALGLDHQTANAIHEKMGEPALYR